MPRTAPKLGGGSTTLDETAFEARFNMPLVHETVRAELNARRQGTHSTKTRGEVSGGGAKPWRQKGTGRARAGSSRSPIWTGGGTVFGPTPRHYTFKVNRKARRAALRSALSVHAGRGSLAVFDAGAFDTPSTKQASALLADWSRPTPAGHTLIVLSETEAQAGLSFRNLRKVGVMPVADAGVADIIGAASLLVSESALPELVARATAESARADSVGDSAGADSPAPAKSADTDSVGDSAGAESPAPAKSADTDSVGDSAGAESPAPVNSGEAA